MSWALKPVQLTLGTDYSYNGQWQLEAYDYIVPRNGEYAFRKYVDSITFESYPRYLVFNTGFRKTKHEIDDETKMNRTIINIQMTRDLPRYLHQNIWNLARFTFGAGVGIRFYDDFASVADGLDANEYEGFWTNAGDFLQNYTNAYTANIILETYLLTVIGGP